ncbi:3-dehydroquinate synthase II [Nitrososphaera sp.]|uniref:3-dehydroquinate synthase II n=1 Tax=Nitrososphaera sp. TaxID=1971748 RepID=UPI001811F648|nr:3-dehydroquinate synthase II [Nitrososphaera sp.]NWG37206.1 3-dehydroquinate synthase [Nitrososphaera sp.]
MAESKDLIVRPTVPKAGLDKFLSKLKNVSMLNIDPKSVAGKKFQTIFESQDADMVICKTFDQMKSAKQAGKPFGYFKKVLGNADVNEIEKASQAGASFVIVDASDWKIIPLENIIAKLHKSKTKVYAMAASAKEVATMFSVLELGVDGVILATDSAEEVEKASQQLSTVRFPIKVAKITEVKDVGTGERVCVDTASMMGMGEGMLVGSRSNFMLLVHNESVGSSFTSPRPFRVNAGAVYCYTITPDGNTRYLSEVESGTEVWIVNKEGQSRKAVVGRSKIETRPLLLIRAEIEGETGTVILQNAETIRLIKPDGKLLSVTEVKVGDQVLGFAKPPTGRHFGMEVPDEYIVEK